jgi:hypothetical protein
MLKFFDAAAIHGNINAQFLSSLAELAHDIDDLSDNGDILISSTIDRGDFIIIVESTTNGETRRVTM